MNFVFDIDGTTSFDGLSIDPQVLVAFRCLEAAGHAVLLASARPIRDILPMLPADLHRLTMIGGNGSLTAQNGQTKVRATLAPEAFEVVRNLILTHQLDYVVDAPEHFAYRLPQGHFLLERFDFQPHQLLALEKLETATKMLLLNISDPNLFDRIVQEIRAIDVALTFHDDPGGANIDITAAGVDKQQALLEVLAGEPYIAFGNDTNDLEMMAGATYSLAVGSKPALVQAANRQVEANGDAVAQAITETLELLAQP